MALLDLRSYIQTKEKALADYDDRYAWAEKMLVNIAVCIRITFKSFHRIPSMKRSLLKSLLSDIYAASAVTKRHAAIIILQGFQQSKPL